MQLLAPLPEKLYSAISPFVKVHAAAFLALEKRAEPSRKFAERPEAWDSESTRFSAKLADGSMSMLRAFNAVSDHPSGGAIQRQLYIRDFYTQVEIYGIEPWLRNWKGGIPWQLGGAETRRRLAMWKNGKTGYDIVDASMLQLREEGFISNRQRMLVASYLTKNMLVDWRFGERYFKSVLSDYAKGSNLGNWMWVSGAGFNTRLTDVLSPELQARIIDPKKTLRAKFLKDRAEMVPEFEYQETKALWLKKVL